MADVTEVLNQANSGDPAATSRLFELLQRELRALAGRKMAGESPDNTLQASALFNETYLKFASRFERATPETPAGDWANREEFMRGAARVMEHILVDRARTRRATKRGLGWTKVLLDDACIDPEDPPTCVIEVHDACNVLGENYPVHAALVRLRFFGGLSLKETGETLGLTRGQADHTWSFAKAWLGNELGTI